MTDVPASATPDSATPDGATAGDPRAGLSRNGARQGDVSYISLGVPDIERAQAFYGAVLGWRFAPGRPEHQGRQVEEVIPQIGLWSGPQLLGRVVHGAVLAFRVDDLASAVERVREQGGTAGEIHQEPYGLTAACRDNQGMDLYLHELAPTGEPAGANGTAPGDVSYLSLSVPDGGKAQAFYGAVLGWTVTPTDRAEAWSVTDPSPMTGLAGGAEGEAQAVLSYLVDDLALAVERIRSAGGTSTDPVERPYGLEASCTDDQGLAFYLHEFPEA
jgi:uncharacterized protein